jgi:hypothetical protein
VQTFLVHFVGVGDFRDTMLRDLRAQSKHSAHIGIGELAQGIFAEDARLPSNATDVVACRIQCREHTGQQLCLLRAREEFELCDEFH